MSWPGQPSPGSEKSRAGSIVGDIANIAAGLLKGGGKNIKDQQLQYAERVAKDRLGLTGNLKKLRRNIDFQTEVLGILNPSVQPTFAGTASPAIVIGAAGGVTTAARALPVVVKAITRTPWWKAAAARGSAALARAIRMNAKRIKAMLDKAGRPFRNFLENNPGWRQIILTTIGGTGAYGLINIIEEWWLGDIGQQTTDQPVVAAGGGDKEPPETVITETQPEGPSLGEIARRVAPYALGAAGIGAAILSRGGGKGSGPGGAVLAPDSAPRFDSAPLAFAGSPAQAIAPLAAPQRGTDVLTTPMSAQDTLVDQLLADNNYCDKQRNPTPRKYCREGFIKEYADTDKTITWRVVDCKTRKRIKDRGSLSLIRGQI